jgi:hypothetical protein
MLSGTRSGFGRVESKYHYRTKEARFNRGPSTRLNSYLVVERNVGYAAWLLRPQALGARSG